MSDNNLYLKKDQFEDVFKKMQEIKSLEHSKTDILYIEMHESTMRDLACEPELNNVLIASNPNMSFEDNVGRILGARIFIHTDNSKRNMITFVYRADVLIGDSND